VVLASGSGPDGRPVTARWSLTAEAGAGPNVPVAAAAATLRGLMDGRIDAPGAYACVGLLTLDAIMDELGGLPITTRALVVSREEAVLFKQVLGDGFQRLSPSVQRVHGATARTVYLGRGRARGSRNLPVRLLRGLLGVPGPGSYRKLRVTVAPGSRGEAWTRAFGDGAFTSHLRPGRELGQFEERFGPLAFTFEAEPRRGGFRWTFVALRLGPVPIPRRLSPRIRARAFEAGGEYRFSVAVAHPWLGLLFAYAGRLANGARGPT
jgi:hypothetical protein